MIKVSSIMKLIIVVVTMIMLEYLSIFSSVNMSNLKVIIGIIGVFLALLIIHIKKKDNDKYIFLSKYILLYIPIILISIFHTALTYNYSFNETLIALSQYLYIFYAYPLIYIFVKDEKIDKYMNIIFLLIIVILGIKVLIWYLYNYKHIILFRNLLFRYSDHWIRDGLMRLNEGYLYDFAFSYTLYNIYKNKNKLLYYIILISLFLFTIFVSQWRVKLMIMIIIMVIYSLLTSKNSASKFIKKYLIISILIFALIFGGYEYFINTFSTNGSYGGSTSARLDTFIHFYNVLNTKKSFFGLGMLTVNNYNVAAMCFKNIYQNFWIEDLGIVGGIFTFGIFSLYIYGNLFYKSIVIIKNKIKSKINAESILVISLISFNLLSGLVYNIFDQQYAYSIPFYMAIVSYFGSNIFIAQKK